MFWKSPLWQKMQSIADFIVWHLFFLIFATIVLDDLASLTIADSKMFGFYATLFAFHPLSLIWYVLNIIQVLLNILIFIPFICYIYGKRLPFRTLWPWILIAKVFFDISGHHYSFLEYKSLFYVKPVFGLAGVLAHVLIWIPSYSTLLNLIRHRSLHFKPSH